MKWTDEKPTEPGWYWWRDMENPAQLLRLEIRHYEYGGCAKVFRRAFGKVKLFRYEQLDGQWAGPIPKLEE